MVGKVIQNAPASRYCEVKPLSKKKEIWSLLDILQPAAYNCIFHTSGMTKYPNEVAFKFSACREHTLKFLTDLGMHYSSSHQTACFKDTEGLRLHPPPRGSKSQAGHSVATLRVLSCFHSPALRCSCCSVVRFCCDPEAHNLMSATIAPSPKSRIKLQWTQKCWKRQRNGRVLFINGCNVRGSCHAGRWSRTGADEKRTYFCEEAIC
jgi:hypothetical protein